MCRYSAGLLIRMLSSVGTSGSNPWAMAALLTWFLQWTGLPRQAHGREGDKERH